MKRFLFTGLCLISLQSYSQIICPDTVYVGASTSFTTGDSAKTFAWAFDNVDVTTSLSTATVVASGSDFSVSACVNMVVDGTNYFSFNTNHANQLVRLDYGSNPYGSPSVHDLGDLSGALSSGVTEDIDVVKDTASGNWYGFITDGTNLVRLDFGSSLSTTPSTTVFTLDTANVYYGMQVSVMRYKSKWIAFLGNYTTPYIVRVDFGTSLTNTPVSRALPNYGYLSGPCYFSIFQQDSNYYMFVTNLDGNTITRYNFGTNLENNSPTATDLGNPGGLLHYPRGITFVQSCDTFYGLMSNEGSDFVTMDFGGNITNTPSLSDLGSLGTGYGIQTLYPFWYHDTLNFITEGFSSNEIYRLSSYHLPSGGSYSYSSPSTTHTFTTEGTYHVTVSCDQGLSTRRNTFCKDVVAIPATKVSNVGALSEVTVYPNPSSGEVSVTGSVNNGDKVAISCYNIMGQYVAGMTAPVASGRLNATINLEQLPKGIYQLKILESNVLSHSSRITLY